MWRSMFALWYFHLTHSVSQILFNIPIEWLPDSWLALFGVFSLTDFVCHFKLQAKTYCSAIFNWTNPENVSSLFLHRWRTATPAWSLYSWIGGMRKCRLFKWWGWGWTIMHQYLRRIQHPKWGTHALYIKPTGAWAVPPWRAAPGWPPPNFLNIFWMFPWLRVPY